MLPLIILASHHHSILYPDAALCNLESHFPERSPEILAFTVRMEYIVGSSRLEYGKHDREHLPEKGGEQVVFHGIVLDGEFLLCTAFIVHVVRWVCDAQVRMLSVHQRRDVRFGTAIATHQTMVTEQPYIAGSGNYSIFRCRNIKINGIFLHIFRLMFLGKKGGNLPEISGLDLITQVEALQGVRIYIIFFEQQGIRIPGGKLGIIGFDFLYRFFLVCRKNGFIRYFRYCKPGLAQCKQCLPSLMGIDNPELSVRILPGFECILETTGDDKHLQFR